MRMLALLAAAALPAPAAVPPSVPATVAELPVPQDHGEQLVIVQAREFAPGASSGWHVHPGTEIAYVVSGEMELATAGGVRHMVPGDSFVMPRGVPHNGGNHGSDTARVMITLVVDRGAPPRQPVSPPE